MKISGRRALFTVVAACLLLFAGWLVFIGAINTQTAHVKVWVSGSVDEVSIYKEPDRSQAVTVIRTGGQDTAQELDLPSAEPGYLFTQAPVVNYVFVSRAGQQQYQSTAFCCHTATFPQEQRSLTIRGLSSWEVNGN